MARLYSSLSALQSGYSLSAICWKAVVQPVPRTLGLNQAEALHDDANMTRVIRDCSLSRLCMDSLIHLRITRGVSNPPFLSTSLTWALSKTVGFHQSHI
ncbi:hypothetical protein BDZ89DRAFT_386160 [Hymenopellis radicata]|nr:hypothetical protein BDZ89DRAFT_386160 [Hymenopellis radicata]